VPKSWLEAVDQRWLNPSPDALIDNDLQWVRNLLTKLRAFLVRLWSLNQTFCCYAYTGSGSKYPNPKIPEREWKVDKQRFPGNGVLHRPKGHRILPG
jgi:hypothetical protein